VASNIITDRINDIDVHAVVEHCHAHADESLPQGVLAAATSKLLDLVASCSTVAVSNVDADFAPVRAGQLRWGVNGRGFDVQRSRPPPNELAEGAHLADVLDRPRHLSERTADVHRHSDPAGYLPLGTKVN